MAAPKREKLLQTAEAVFSKEGFKGVSVDRVLKQAGVAKMTLYKGFESKEALICETLRRRGDRLAAHIEHEIAQAGPNATDQLLRCFDAMESWSKRSDFNGCYFINALGEFGGANDGVGQIVRDYKSRFLDRLETLCIACDASEPHALAQSLMILIDGATVTHMTMNNGSAYRRAKSVAEKIIAAQ